MRLLSCVILLVTAATNPIVVIGCGDYYTGDDGGGGLDTFKTFEGNAIAAETRLVSQSVERARVIWAAAFLTRL